MASFHFVFMRLSDKVNQRTLFAASAVIQIVGMMLLAMFPLTIPVALLHVFLLQFGGGFGAQSYFQLWSSEMFPTMLRSTAQGICFAIVWIGLGVISCFLLLLTATGPLAKSMRLLIFICDPLSLATCSAFLFAKKQHNQTATPVASVRW